MKMKCILIIFFHLITVIYMQQPGVKKDKSSPPQHTEKNPNFIRDRKRNIIMKPEMPPTWTDKHRQEFSPSWMDYCDPYHCNDYFRNACGLNRRKMKFKWFQSICHIALNNQCANFRGSLKYDWIETKFCVQYVMFLRAGCPSKSSCTDELDPICGLSSIDGHAVLFKNQCFMDAVNCQNATLQEYDKVYMDICEYKLTSTLQKIK